jgi:TfoX/Sxy family transcriptional regulator of competence genes
MASTKEYLDFILEQLSDLDEISFRAMMGEYIIYYRGKVVGGIYDDRFLVKPTKSAMEMMPNADMEQPYDGAKQMILVDDVDNRGVMYRLIQAIWEDLPKRELKSMVEFYKKDLVPKYDIPEL